MWREIAAVIVVIVAIAGLGCSPACDAGDDANTPTLYEGGTAVNGYYFSSSSHQDLLYFPGGKRYDLVHHLGFEPIIVQMSWSFSEAGIGTFDQTGKSTLTTAAGNSALVQLKNDQFIRVKNDSCAEFWLLVVAFGNPGTGVIDAAVGDGDVDAGAE